MRRFFHYLTRIRELGLRGSFERITIRTKQRLHSVYWKKLAEAGQAGSSWRLINKRHNLSPFSVFFASLKNQNFIDQIKSMPEWQNSLPDEDWERLAHDAANNCIDILGSGKQCFAKGIPWREDIKRGTTSNHPNWVTNSLLYYRDIHVTTKLDVGVDEYNPDIKVPWEISRMQHLIPLMFTYEKNKEENAWCAKAFQSQASNWIDENPYLLGPNWVCPMDVGLRAVNLIWGFHHFKNTESISEKFWKKLVCSLYDHAHYLERNWEKSDKTSNHYLSDLIGYWYLCWFFKDIDHFQAAKKWCYREILIEAEKQLSDDGSNYEGSVHYHKLVTELFFHFYMVAIANNQTLPGWFTEKLRKAFGFLDDCTDTAGNLVQIGDNDSGKVVGGVRMSFEPLDTIFLTENHSRRTALLNVALPEQNRRQKKTGVDGLLKHEEILLSDRSSRVINCNPDRPEESSENSSRRGESNTIHYPNFGLTIIKDNDTHFTYRHPTFSSHQPSGHFHQDLLAITLSHKGIPILVDPGSYLYTANATWRNRMRSYDQHSNFYVVDENGKSIDQLPEYLFQLDRAEQEDTARITDTEVENYHDAYADYGLRAHRKLEYTDKTIVITDCFESSNSSTTNLRGVWNFIFHPAITLEQKNKNEWLIQHDETLVGIFFSELEMRQTTSHYSPAYGHIKDSCKLTGTASIKEKITSTIRLE